MSNITNVINWFEIAVSDIKRATKFYETILDINLSYMETAEFKMAMFPYDAANETTGGALMQGPIYHPSAAGTLIYLNANPAIQTVIDRIEDAGGKITMPKTLINEQVGYMALFTDTEGNTIALHANA